MMEDVNESGGHSEFERKWHSDWMSEWVSVSVSEKKGWKNKGQE